MSRDRVFLGLAIRDLCSARPIHWDDEWTRIVQTYIRTNPTFKEWLRRSKRVVSLGTLAKLKLYDLFVALGASDDLTGLRNRHGDEVKPIFETKLRYKIHKEWHALQVREEEDEDEDEDEDEEARTTVTGTRRRRSRSASTQVTVHIDGGGGEVGYSVTPTRSRRHSRVSSRSSTSSAQGVGIARTRSSTPTPSRRHSQVPPASLDSTTDEDTPTRRRSTSTRRRRRRSQVPSSPASSSSLSASSSEERATPTRSRRRRSQVPSSSSSSADELDDLRTQFRSHQLTSQGTSQLRSPQSSRKVKRQNSQTRRQEVASAQGYIESCKAACHQAWLDLEAGRHGSYGPLVREYLELSGSS